jgi:lysine 2,3-aminomutase
MASPHYVIDLAGGKGKVPIMPDYVNRVGDNTLRIRNYRGEMVEYIEAG